MTANVVVFHRTLGGLTSDQLNAAIYDETNPSQDLARRVHIRSFAEFDVELDEGLYRKVYEGELPDPTLDRVYAAANSHPEEMFVTGDALPFVQGYRDAHLRSLSVGDVVMIGEVAYACERVGWKEITGVALARALGTHDGYNSAPVVDRGAPQP